jgi:hypothetical protein
MNRASTIKPIQNQGRQTVQINRVLNMIGGPRFAIWSIDEKLR